MTPDLLAHSKAICRALGTPASREPLPPADFTRAFCEAHRLHALVASVLSLRQNADSDYAPLMARGMRDVAKQMKIDAAETALSHRFTEAAIRHIVLKGSHTRTFYPQELTRTGADIDWQINPADVRKADALLIADGWTLQRAEADERCYEKAPRLRLELHIAPEGFHPAQRQTMQAMFDRAVAVDGLRFHLTDDDAYIYTLFHLYKHFILAGAGVRMFLDVYTIASRAALDRAYIDAQLETLGIGRFARRVQQLNAVLFEGADSDHELDLLVRYIFAAGAYGVNTAQLALEPLNLGIAGTSRRRQFARNFCLDASSMAKRYPCLTRAKWLYPFCVIHRVVHGLRFRRTVLKKALTAQHEGRTHRDDLTQILEIADIV